MDEQADWRWLQARSLQVRSLQPDGATVLHSGDIHVPRTTTPALLACAGRLLRVGTHVCTARRHVSACVGTHCVLGL